MQIRYEFINDSGVVIHTAIGEVETKEDFVSNEVIFREKFGYNENWYNVETQTFIDRCVKTEVEELKIFDPINLLLRKMF